MKQEYIKTSSTYLIYSFIQFSVLSVLLSVCKVSNGYFHGLWIVGVLYLCLVIYCGYHTMQERKRMGEIISQGRSYDGIVKKIIEVPYEAYFSRFGKMESSAYLIEAEVIDEFATSSLYYSELVRKGAIKTIPKHIKVYRYLDQTAILWEKTVNSEKFAIEQDNTIRHSTMSRMILQTINGLLFIMTVGIVIAILAEYLL